MPEAPLLHVKSPCRVDLAGGTLDLWPLWHLVDNPATVNLAIEVFAEVEIRPPQTAGHITLESLDLGVRESIPVDAVDQVMQDTRLPLLWTLVDGLLEVTGGTLPDKGFYLTSKSGSPPGAGLGGSSALAYGVARALDHLCGGRTSPEVLIDLAQGAETSVLKIPTGRQDYYPAAYGGALLLDYKLHRPVPANLEVDKEWLDEHMLVWYSGASRSSGTANWAMFRRAVEGEAGALEALNAIADKAGQMAQAMFDMDAAKVGKVLGEEWDLRKSLAAEVTCEEFSRVEEGIQAMGGVTMKACGAGGGGCAVLWMAKPGEKLRQDLLELLESCGGESSRILPAGLCSEPSRVTAS